MAKQKKADGDGVWQKTAIQYDIDNIVAIGLMVKGGGFVPLTVLQDQFQPDKVSQGLAVLYRDFRMLRECRRPWKDGVDVLGYEWADRRFSKSEIKKIPPEFEPVIKLTSPLAPKYGDFESVTAKCRWTVSVLGGVPVKDEDGAPINSFQRDSDGNVQILRYNMRAMIGPALVMIGKEQALARRIGFSTIKLKVNGNLSKVERPVNDQGQGKGFCRSEVIADGTEFVVKAMIPTSILSVTEYLQALRLAGEVCGLSPGRSAGFGDFEVIEAE